MEVDRAQDVTQTSSTAIHRGQASAESLQAVIPSQPRDAESLTIGMRRG
jgi:hypothetical protein